MQMKNYDLSASCNTIEKNTNFIGNFNSESDFRVDGSFEGNIETKGKVVIGKTEILMELLYVHLRTLKANLKEPSMLRTYYQLDPLVKFMGMLLCQS